MQDSHDVFLHTTALLPASALPLSFCGCSQNFGSGPLASGDSAVHGSVVAACICSFAREEQSIVNRLCQRLFHSISADFSVAICSSRQWIVLPVMAVCVLEQRFEVLHTRPEPAVQSLHGPS